MAQKRNKHTNTGHGVETPLDSIHLGTGRHIRLESVPPEDATGDKRVGRRSYNDARYLRSVVDITHSALKVLLDAGNLRLGQYYRITDFATIHRITNTSVINTGTVEPLIVFATATNKIDSLAYSSLYPDDIIHYDIDDVLCEDGMTPRKGIITRRVDTVRNIQMDVDWRAVKYRRWKILSRNFTTGESINGTEVGVTINSNRPNFGVFPNNFFKYEIAFGAITNAAGTVNITLTFNNGTVTKPLHRFDSLTWTANQLANTSGSLMYNTVKDSFVFMTYGSIGNNLLHKYVCPTDSAIWTPAFGISFNVDINDFQDYLILNGADNKNVIMNNSNATANRIDNYSSVCFASCQDVIWEGGAYRSTFGIHTPNTAITDTKFGLIYDSVFEISFNRSNIGQCGLTYLVHHNTGFSTLWQNIHGAYNSVLKLPLGTKIECTVENFIYVPNGGTGMWLTHRGRAINAGIFTNGSSLGANVAQRMTIDAGLQKTLIGYFTSNNLYLNRNLDFTAFDETNLVASNSHLDNTNVGQLVVRAVPTAVGAVNLIGRDSLGNVVQTTLNQDEIPDGTTYKQYSQAEKTKLAGIEELADVTDAVNVGVAVNGVAAKTTPVDADTVPLTDSADSNLLKKISWANIKATLKIYFDTLYNLYVHPNHTGDVVSINDGDTVIANDAVTNAKLANVATATVKGRITAATGDPEDLTATQATSLLDLFSSSLKGLAPASGGGTANFLRADGAWTSSVSFVAIPASKTATGTVGQFAVDSNFLYICVATNTWQRIAIDTSTW